MMMMMIKFFFFGSFHLRIHGSIVKYNLLSFFREKKEKTWPWTIAIKIPFVFFCHRRRMNVGCARKFPIGLLLSFFFGSEKKPEQRQQIFFIPELFQ